MDDLLNEWAENAQKHADSNLRFLKSLTTHPVQKTVDETAKVAHKKVFDQIDCLQCARCCKSLNPDFGPKDIERTAAHLGMSEPRFIEKYLSQKPYGDYFTKTLPCPFLDGTACSIYEARPNACRGYPFTDEAHFSKRGLTNAFNTETCPATFHIVKEMRDKMGFVE